MSLISSTFFLGDQLVKMGIITEQQLNRALQVQEEKRLVGKKPMLGQTLIELGFCSEEQIAKALAKKSGFEFLSINNTGIDLAFANLITPETAERYKLIPIGLKNGKLQVAMLNPNDIIAIDDIQILTGYEIEPIVVPDRELYAVIEQFSNMSSNVEKQAQDEEDEDTNKNDALNDAILKKPV